MPRTGVAFADAWMLRREQEPLPAFAFLASNPPLNSSSAEFCSTTFSRARRNSFGGATLRLARPKGVPVGPNNTRILRGAPAENSSTYARITAAAEQKVRS
jgi:hypothetical protein